MDANTNVIPLGFCQCACGEKTRLARADNKKLGHVKGQPQRFINGHNNKRLVPLLERYCERVDKSGGRNACWPWIGTLNFRTGYGVIMENSTLRFAHRIAWELATGIQPPKGRKGSARLVVMHLCDNPRCCNPDHLALGTQAANLLDMRNKRRRVWQKKDQCLAI